MPRSQCAVFVKEKMHSPKDFDVTATGRSQQVSYLIFGIFNSFLSLLATLSKRRHETFVFFHTQTIKNSISVKGLRFIKDYSCFASASGSGVFGQLQIQQKQINARLSLKLFRRTALRHGLAEQDCTSINSRSQSILSF